MLRILYGNMKSNSRVSGFVFRGSGLTGLGFGVLGFRVRDFGSLGIRVWLLGLGRLESELLALRPQLALQ